ncbi:hypothetical protein F5Y10DRAFT_23295 [Nemania abortiva]|nr:hypothetical protein F5Y10DRAFT_23295 [Nemania abortiva]
MSSSSDDGLSGGGDNGDDTPTHNLPWPYVDAISQGRFERKFIADGGTINFDAVPKLQFWASWFGLGDEHRAIRVLSKVRSHSIAASRPLTGPEANAVGEHTVNSLRYFAWIRPITCAIAASLCFAGRRTFKFALYQPKTIKFDPYSFPTKKMPLLKGRYAAAVWHVARFASYYPLVWFPTAIVFGSIAESTFAAHAMRDPRLDGLTESLRQNAQQKKIERQTQMRQRARNPQQTSHGSYQDSPTSQNYGDTDHATQSSYSFERTSTATETPQTTQPSWPRSTYTQPAPRKVQEDVPSSGPRHEDDAFDPLSDDDDDASPVAPSARRPGTGQGSPSSTGSSWDRIRQQARSGTSNWERGDSSGQEQGWAQLRQDKTRNPKDSSPKTDSYSYSSDDEEREKRKYEKEQAQKEFDALVEAERRGDGSGGNSRSWRKG